MIVHENVPHVARRRVSNQVLVDRPPLPRRHHHIDDRRVAALNCQTEGRHAVDVFEVRVRAVVEQFLDQGRLESAAGVVMTLMEVQGRRRGIRPRLGVDVRAERYQNIHDIEILWIFWYDDVQGRESPIVDFTWIFRVFEEEGAERGNIAARDGVVDTR